MAMAGRLANSLALALWFCLSSSSLPTSNLVVFALWLFISTVALPFAAAAARSEAVRMGAYEAAIRGEVAPLSRSPAVTTLFLSRVGREQNLAREHQCSLKFAFGLRRDRC
eukprot:47615-Rhodomonas_salina.1